MKISLIFSFIFLVSITKRTDCIEHNRTLISVAINSTHIPVLNTINSTHVPILNHINLTLLPVLNTTLDLSFNISDRFRSNLTNFIRRKISRASLNSTLLNLVQLNSTNITISELPESELHLRKAEEDNFESFDENEQELEKFEDLVRNYNFTQPIFDLNNTNHTLNATETLIISETAVDIHAHSLRNANLSEIIENRNKSDILFESENLSQWEPEKEIKFQNEDVRADNETDNNELPTFIFSVEAFENRRSSKASLTELGVFIKQTILRDLGRRYDDLTVVFSSNSTDIENGSIDKHAVLPIYVSVSLNSSIPITRDEFENALMEIAINKNQCNKENGKVECMGHVKDKHSLLLITDDFWIKLTKFRRVKSLDSHIFTYQPAWIIGLTIIGLIIAIFFVGCLIAICYTRRPYRRSGKIYEVETAVRKNPIPQIPNINPATKAAALPKNREMYY